MSDLVINNTTCQITAKSDTPIPSTDGDVSNLLHQINAFHAAVPLTKLDVNRDAVDLTLYVYKFEAADGRKWKQNIWVTPTKVVQDFSVGNGTMAGGWDLTEFELNRPVRATCISLIQNFKLYDLKVRW